MCFQTVRCKDFRLAANITELQLTYALCIAFCNRIAQCSIYHGYSYPENASRLKQVASGIQLPAVLASYIESIGSVTMSNGVTVVPYVTTPDLLFPSTNLQMIGPGAILGLAGREIPPTPWQLDDNWIIAYNDATTRAARSGMNFRPVDNSTYTGRLEMLVSYRATDDGLLLPEAPQSMTEAEAQLGAVYRFRDRNNTFHWLGDNHELLFNSHTAIPLDPHVLFSDICVAAFKGMFVSTD